MKIQAIAPIIWETLTNTSDDSITGIKHTHNVVTTSTGSRRIIIGNYTFQQDGNRILIFKKNYKGLWASVKEGKFYPIYKYAQNKEAKDPAYIQDDPDFQPDNAGDTRVAY